MNGSGAPSVRIAANLARVIQPVTGWTKGPVTLILSTIIGIAVLAYAPYAFSLYLTPIITLIIWVLYFRKDQLPSDDDATVVYGNEPDQLSLPQQSA